MILIWNMIFPNSPGYERRVLFSTGSADSASPLTVNQMMFQFLRTSISPLMSTMVIENMNFVLNGTRMECTYGGGVMSKDIIGNGIIIRL